MSEIDVGVFDRDKQFDPANEPYEPVVIPLDDYTRVDARIGYKFPDRDLEASLIIQNALDDFHQEFPTGEYFQRQVLFQVSARF